MAEEKKRGRPKKQGEDVVTETPKADKKSVVTFDASVERVANVDVGGGKGFKVLSMRCPAMPEAGLLKVIGDAGEGDKVKVTVERK